MIRYGLGKPREDEGGWRRAECEVGDVVVDSTTRPADARRATAFVTDSTSLARTRGGTHVRDRVLVLDQQAELFVREQRISPGVTLEPARRDRRPAAARAAPGA